MPGATGPMYHNYAPIYSMIGLDRFSEYMARQVRSWLVDSDIPIMRVLDLGCGDGAAALVFASSSCAVVGIDRSRPMVDLARVRARRAGYDVTFFSGDMRSLTSGRSAVAPKWFDLVICFSDSLNYLTCDGDLDLVFHGVMAALRPGGYMVCDVSSEAAFEAWENRDVIMYDTSDYLVYNRLNYDKLTRLGTGRIVWFARDGDHWVRNEEIHVERAWTDAEILQAIEESGLTLLDRMTPEGTEVKSNSPRIVYMAQKGFDYDDEYA